MFKTLARCFLLLATAAVVACSPRAEAAPSAQTTPGTPAGTAAVVTTDPKPVETAAPGIHPLSVEALTRRSYSADPLERLRRIPAEEGLEAWEITYRSDGLLQYALLEKPAGPPPPGGFPVIILCHGYIPPSAYSTANNYRLVTRHYAQGGFLVLKPDYRGHGRSEGVEEGPTRTILYTIDVLNLLAGLRQIEEADPTRVYLYGHSMGGEIALRVLTVGAGATGVEMHAATLWAAVTQPFPENTLYYTRRRDPALAEQQKTLLSQEIPPEVWPSLSPLTYLNRIEAPLVVHHGTADESVPFSWSGPFIERLKSAGLDFVFHQYPGANHNISGSFYLVMDKDMDFFRSTEAGR